MLIDGVRGNQKGSDMPQAPWGGNIIDQNYIPSTMAPSYALGNRNFRLTPVFFFLFIHQTKVIDI